MAYVVKITSGDDGEKRKNPVWCYIYNICGGNATLCGFEYFGHGESKAEFKTKDGKITCPKCREIIKQIKAVKL